MKYRGKHYSFEDLVAISRAMHGENAPRQATIYARIYGRGMGWSVEDAVETPRVRKEAVFPHRGKFFTYRELAREAFGIHGKQAPSISLIKKRIHDGKTPEEAVNEPKRGYIKRDQKFWQFTHGTVVPRGER